MASESKFYQRRETGALFLNQQNIVPVWIADQYPFGKTNLIFRHGDDSRRDEPNIAIGQLLRQKIDIVGCDHCLPVHHVICMNVAWPGPTIPRRQILEEL